MTEAAPPDVKRRRLSAADGDSLGARFITDLPSGVLAHAASFLAAPSRALFAIALNKNSAALPNERSSAIVGNEWDTLDFGQIEQDLAEKLSDDDVEKVLLCINAVHKLKKLRMTHCLKITGECFQPLRGSSIIEVIDLSLTCDGEEPSLESPLSFHDVLPILHSIIDRGVVQHITLPRHWRDISIDYREMEIRHPVHQFVIEYNRMLLDRHRLACCEKCNSSLSDVESESNWMKIIRNMDYKIIHAANVSSSTATAVEMTIIIKCLSSVRYVKEYAAKIVKKLCGVIPATDTPAQIAKML